MHIGGVVTTARGNYIFFSLIGFALPFILHPRCTPPYYDLSTVHTIPLTHVAVHGDVQLDKRQLLKQTLLVPLYFPPDPEPAKGYSYPDMGRYTPQSRRPTPEVTEVREYDFPSFLYALKCIFQVLIKTSLLSVLIQ